MKYSLVVIFLLMCTSQWFVPAAMIVEQEDILDQGTTFRFKTAPVDPTDPFRGKYITLNFEGATFHYSGDRSWIAGQEVFVIVEEDNEGFARVRDVVPDEPEDGEFFEAEVEYFNTEYVRLHFPFDRFYLEESKASEAEQLYRETRRDSTQVAYAEVSLKNGKAALNDVLINDRSIVDVVRELNQKNP